VACEREVREGTHASRRAADSLTKRHARGVRTARDARATSRRCHLLALEEPKQFRVDLIFMR